MPANPINCTSSAVLADHVSGAAFLAKLFGEILTAALALNQRAMKGELVNTLTKFLASSYLNLLGHYDA